MQNKALETVFTESYINDVEAGLDHLTKVCIESCATTAYNNIIFEAALSDEILEEASKEDEKEGKSAFAGVGNAAFKAIQTLKMFFKNIFNKIRVAINEFIKNETEKKTAKAFEEYKKAAKEIGDNEVKVKNIYLDAKVVFPTVIDFKKLVKIGDEHDMAKKLAATISSGLQDNYKDAKKALADAKSVAEVNKVLTGLTGFAADMKESFPISEILTGKKSDITTVSKSVKDQYSKSVAKVNEFIKTKETNLKTAKTDSEIKQIKDEVLLAQKLIAFLHAAFIGQLKWAVAANKNAMAAIKSAKNGGVEESAFEEFMGLQLL